jgi:small subunit ribosomal protein S14
MAKKSMIAREVKRVKASQRLAKKRADLKAIIVNPGSSSDAVDEAVVKLQKMPRDASKCRQMTRCRDSGRPRGVYRKFGLCRNKLREAAMRGDVPGLVKASW